MNCCRFSPVRMYLKSFCARGISCCFPRFVVPFSLPLQVPWLTPSNVAGHRVEQCFYYELKNRSFRTLRASTLAYNASEIQFHGMSNKTLRISSLSFKQPGLQAGWRMQLRHLSCRDLADGFNDARMKCKREWPVLSTLNFLQRKLSSELLWVERRRVLN